MTGTQFKNIYEEWKTDQLRQGKGVPDVYEFAADICTRQEMILRELRNSYAALAMPQETSHIVRLN